MRLRRSTLVLASVFALALAGYAPSPAAAQTFNLRDLLTDFVKNGITLSDPPAGSPFPSHAHHFVGDESLIPLEQLNRQLAIQLSTFPLASSSGGFTYNYDPNLGTFTRASDSFGPVYAERADTNGKNKFSFGINYSHFSFDKIDDLNLRDGDVQIVFRHQDLPPSPCCLAPFFEGDVIQTKMFLKIESDITAFTFSYGVTDRLDIGAAVPIVRTSIQARVDATINRLATGANTSTAGIHTFVGGGDTQTFQQSGSASGVGDVVVRAKYRLTSSNVWGGAIGAEARLATGEERDLLGTGTTQARGFLIGSAHLGTFSPHLNAGYTWSSDKSVIPDEFNVAAGFDWALNPRFTFVVDALGRTFKDGQTLQEQNTSFQYNTNPATTPVDLHQATLPQLGASVGNPTSWSGSIGFRVSPVGNLLLTFNGLFALNSRGLQSKFAPLVAAEYNF
jgi:hypothetical protein